MNTVDVQEDFIDFYDKVTDQFIAVIDKKLSIQNCNYKFAELFGKKKKSVLFKKSIIKEIYKIIDDNDDDELKFLTTNSIEAAFQGIYENICLPLKNRLNKTTLYTITLYPVSSEIVIIAGKVFKPNILIYSLLKTEKYSFKINNKTEYLDFFADKLVSTLYGKISLPKISLMKSALNILICEFFDISLGKKRSSKKCIVSSQRNF